MGQLDQVGTMARRLRELDVTNDGGLRLILQALLEPTTQVVDAGWDASQQWTARVQVPPSVVFRAMISAVLLDLVHDDQQRQHADTDGLAKQHDVLHRYLRAAGIEPEVVEKL
jgi:hypothetical protein